MEDIVVTSWSELNERLYENSWNEQLGRFRSPLAYRGMQDARFGLTTSLVRLGGEYHKHEDDLVRNFRKYAHHRALLGDSVWYWLALGQHVSTWWRLMRPRTSPRPHIRSGRRRLPAPQASGSVSCSPVPWSGRRTIATRTTRRVAAAGQL